MSLMGGVERWITSKPWRRKCFSYHLGRNQHHPCSVPALAAIATWKSQVSTSVSWVNSSGPKSPRNFGSMTEINTKKIWWIGETPWKRKHWKHQDNWCFIALGLHRVGFKSQEHGIIESFPSVKEDVNFLCEISFPPPGRKLSTTVILWDPFSSFSFFKKYRTIEI